MPLPGPCWGRAQKLLTHQDGCVLMLPAEGPCHEAVVSPVCVCLSNRRVKAVPRQPVLALRQRSGWLEQEDGRFC